MNIANVKSKNDLHVLEDQAPKQEVATHAGAENGNVEKSQTKLKKKTAPKTRNEPPDAGGIMTAVNTRSILDRLELVESNVQMEIESLLPFDIRDKGSDKRRIGMFAESYRNNTHVPNIVVVETPDGKRRLVDGHHRAKGALLADWKTVKADVYRGSLADCIHVALELNRSTNPLKPRDIVHAAVMARGNGGAPSISELARLAGISRQTVRSYISQMDDGSLTAGVRGLKRPKSDDEVAAGLADKVVEAVEIGIDKVVDLVFERLSAEVRSKLLERLQRRFFNTPES